MLANNMSGTILLRENTLLPEGLAVESEVFLPGWRVVKNLDSSVLARNIEGADWNFFYLAGEIRATAVGRDKSGTLRRAVKRVLAKNEKHFNSLEITRAVSKRFLGIPLIKVVAHSRHIQQGMCLVPTKDLVFGGPVPAAPETRLDNGEELRQAEVIAKPHTALVSSS